MRISQLNLFIYFIIFLFILNISFVIANDQVLLAENTELQIQVGSGLNDKSDVTDQTDEGDDNSDADDENNETFQVQESQYFSELTNQEQVKTGEELNNLKADSEEVDKLRDKSLNLTNENNDTKSGWQYFLWTAFTGLMAFIAFVLPKSLLGFTSLGSMFDDLFDGKK